MSAEHGEVSETSGGKESDATPGKEPVMEPLQPRRTVASRRERPTRRRTPLPMLLPASPVSKPAPDPQTPTPILELLVPDPQTPAPTPELLLAPALSHVPDPETPPTGILLDAPVMSPA